MLKRVLKYLQGHRQQMSHSRQAPPMLTPAMIHQVFFLPELSQAYSVPSMSVSVDNTYHVHIIFSFSVVTREISTWNEARGGGRAYTPSLSPVAGYARGAGKASVSWGDAGRVDEGLSSGCWPKRRQGPRSYSWLVP